MQRWIDRHEAAPEADQTPVEMPVIAPETTQEMLARMISQHLEREAQRQGFGTWEDEDDFEDEDPDILDFTPYEMEELQSDDDLPDPEAPMPPLPRADASPATSQSQEDSPEERVDTPATNERSA